MTDVDTFREEWFGPASQKALGDLFGRVQHLEGDIVEVGCWTGRSTTALANACYPSILHAVDTWQGSPGEVSAQLAVGRDVFGEFTSNMERFTAGNVIPHRMGWRDYFAIHEDPVRFVHIDAEHSYLEVRDNLNAVLALMVRGGIVCGDDAHHPPVQRAVADVLGEDVRVTATLWWTVV